MKEIDIDASVSRLTSFARIDETLFDATLSHESPTHDIDKKTEILKKRIITRSSKLKLQSENPYHKIIFKAVAAGLESIWVKELTMATQLGHYNQALYFVQWINAKDVSRNGKNRYEVLDDYAAFRINQQGVKHSEVRQIKKLIMYGLESSNSPSSHLLYLRHLLRISKRTKAPKRDSYTLTGWFDIPWLRGIVGEKQYLQLESPSRLMLSFRVTIAMTLLYLLEARQQWDQKVIQTQQKRNHPRWWQYWDCGVLSEAGSFDEECRPADALTNLLWIDFVIEPKAEELKNAFCLNGRSKFSLHHDFWQQPVIFNEHYHSQHTSLEQRLAGWLVACEAVQPSDIRKLKKSDYAEELNSHGKLSLLQLTYYKGRSGRFHYPQVLMADDCWTQAFHKYLEGLDSRQNLFSTDITRLFVMPNLGDKSRVNTEVNFLFKLWKSRTFQGKLTKALKRANALPIFHKAMLALENGDLSAASSRLTRREYEASKKRPLPSQLFTLSAIKTSAVHAGSDAYRDSDLINHHSHTSHTEKHQYLTDSNKEWLDQCGRITRLVIHDLQNVVYQPSLESIQKTVKDLEVRTRVIGSTNQIDAQVIELARGNISFPKDGYIIVMDTIESALFFIHYLEQAESVMATLIRLRPDFVEYTLLANLEWMTRTLHRMKSAKAAHEQYSFYRQVLPPLFDHLLESAV